VVKSSFQENIKLILVSDIKIDFLDSKPKGIDKIKSVFKNNHFCIPKKSKKSTYFYFFL
jgi:hypothetical protein